MIAAVFCHQFSGVDMTQERMLWVLAIVGIAALFIFRFNKIDVPATTANPGGSLDASVSPDNSSTNSGMSYLVANQPAFAFAPPVNNFLPSLVAGGQQVTVQPVNAAPTEGDGSDFGCGTCQ